MYIKHLATHISNKVTNVLYISVQNLKQNILLNTTSSLDDRGFDPRLGQKQFQNKIVETVIKSIPLP